MALRMKKLAKFLLVLLASLFVVFACGSSMNVEVFRNGKGSVTLSVSKEKVLADAQKEIERLTKVATELADEKTTLSRQLLALRCRGFWARLLDKEK